jgi:dihydrofolate reductase
MKIAALVLTDLNNSIGKNDLVLNYFPAYVKYFEELTSGAPIIMGRKTFESIGHFLKSRKNIVITRNEKYHSSRARTFFSLDQALEFCRNEEKIFVIGGVNIFEQLLSQTAEIYRTSIKARFRSEQYYPEINTSEFILVSSECVVANKDNRFDYCVEKWQRLALNLPPEEAARHIVNG